MIGGTVRSGSLLPRRALPRGGLAAVGHRDATRDTTRLAFLGRGLILGTLLVPIVVFALCFGSEGIAPTSAAAVPPTRQVVPTAAGPRAAAARVPATLAASAPTVRELVGQRFVVAMRGTSPSPSLLARVRRGEIGGVILFGSNIVDRGQLRGLTAALQLAAREARRPPVLVATDQEGGRVRRLAWAGPFPSTTELGGLGAPRIRAAATASGKTLRLAGVNVNLAPVADVPVSGSFMALDQRTFAASPLSVTAAAVAFARGLAAARVAAAVKHFPGIGRAALNTDRAAVTIGATQAELTRGDLVPFRAAIRAGTPMVMISNATYPALDGKPATWSPRIQSLLRRELGFEGVTITDALDGAAATRGRTLPAVTALAAEAGIDLLLLTGSEASSAAAFEHVVANAERGRLSTTALRASYDRIVELKRLYG